jgi:O-acetyl-ADP-ribose deacetylase
VREAHLNDSRHAALSATEVLEEGQPTEKPRGDLLGAEAREHGVTGMQLNWGTTAVRIVEGDITEQDADAIVNAANSSLMGGGGVDGAIHRRGGPRILEECRAIRRSSWPDGLPSGRAVITNGGLLRARHVIHTVGPVWRGGRRGEEATLAECYTNSLGIAKERGLRSVAFPSISTGAYGYPIKEAGEVALGTVKEFVEREGWPPAVTFVLFSVRDLETYERLASAFRPSS